MTVLPDDTDSLTLLGMILGLALASIAIIEGIGRYTRAARTARRLEWVMKSLQYNPTPKRETALRNILVTGEAQLIAAHSMPSQIRGTLFTLLFSVILVVNPTLIFGFLLPIASPNNQSIIACFLFLLGTLLIHRKLRYYLEKKKVESFYIEDHEISFYIEDHEISVNPNWRTFQPLLIGRGMVFSILFYAILLGSHLTLLLLSAIYYIQLEKFSWITWYAILLLSGSLIGIQLLSERYIEEKKTE